MHWSPKQSHGQHCSASSEPQFKGLLEGHSPEKEGAADVGFNVGIGVIGEPVDSGAPVIGELVTVGCGVVGT